MFNQKIMVYLTFMLYILTLYTTETNYNDFKQCFIFHFAMLFIEVCYWEVVVGNFWGASNGWMHFC